MTEYQCECGHWSGEPCQWSGPRSDMVEVEWMPAQYRGSHVAAGNSGAWPHNGALRLEVEESCAERMLQFDADWVRLVSQKVK